MRTEGRTDKRDEATSHFSQFRELAEKWEQHEIFWCENKIKYIILIYIQQDATLHSLFYLETALHVSGGTTTHHQERKQLYLQHLLFVRPLLLPAAIAAGSSNG